MASSLPSANELRLELQSAVQALSILVYPGSRLDIRYSESTPSRYDDHEAARNEVWGLSRVSPEKGGIHWGNTITITFWVAEVLRSCFTVPNGQLSFWQLCQVREGKVSRYPSKGFHLFLYIRKYRGKTHGKASGIVTSLVILRLWCCSSSTIAAAHLRCLHVGHADACEGRQISATLDPQMLDISL